MNTEPLNDAETLAWRSLVVLTRQGLPRLERTFRQHGLIELEYGLMAIIDEQPDGTMCAGDLAELAGVTPSRLSHRLKKLEDRGDITRAAMATDARMIQVSLTDQGRDRIAGVVGQHRADIRRLIFEPLEGEEQAAALADALAAIAANLSDHPFLTDYMRSVDRPA